MIGLKKCESSHRFYNFFKSYRRSWSVSMFDDWNIISIMYIDFNASESVLEINEISLGPAATKELITS